MTAPVRFEVDDGVARLVLDRPEAANAIGAASIAACREIADTLEHAAGVRCVVIESAVPGVFSVGGDLQYIDEADGDVGRRVHAGARGVHALVATLARIDAPVIAAVGGVAAGGGMGLALAADLVVASRSATFTCAYTKIGYPADTGMSWLLPRLVGHRQALSLLLRCPVLDAAQALELGLVTSVVDDDQLDAEVEALVDELREGPTQAFGTVKRLVRDAYDAPLEAHLETEARLIAHAATGTEAQERIAAFVRQARPRT